MGVVGGYEGGKRGRVKGGFALVDWVGPILAAATTTTPTTTSSTQRHYRCPLVHPLALARQSMSNPSPCTRSVHLPLSREKSIGHAIGCNASQGHSLTLRLSLSTSSTDPRTFRPEPTSSRRLSPSPTRSSWTSSAPDASKSRECCSSRDRRVEVESHRRDIRE